MNETGSFPSKKQVRIPADLAERFRQGYEIGEKQSVELANAGWTLPMWSTLAGVNDILKHTGIDKVDDYFVRYYETNQDGDFDRLRSDLLSHSSLKHWRPLVEQCLRAYDRSDYLVPIPALIAIIEGLVANAGGRFLRKADPKNVVQERLNSSSKKSFTRLIWLSTDAFIHRLFESHSFDAGRPVSLNRHWILHGRDVPDWTHADCLRLLQALHTVSCVVD